MPWEADRTELLQILTFANPGRRLDKVLIDQSDAFVFRNGYVVTFNGEVSCKVKTGFPKEYAAAIKGNSFLSLLNKLELEKLTFTEKEDGLDVKTGGRIRSKLKADAEIRLPLDSLEKPEKDSWQALPDGFTEAVSMVESCAGKNDHKFQTVCIHIHPKWVEACDSETQFARYRIKTGLKEPILVRRDSMKHVISFGPTKVAETETWIHFKNPTGAILSCRRHVVTYPDLTEFAEIRGKKIVLPKDLEGAAELGEIFASEQEDNRIHVRTTKKNRLQVRGEGVSGWVSKDLKVKYKGPPLAFCINPKLMIEIVKKYSDAEITKDHLKVTVGKLTYVATLEDPTTPKKDEEDE